MSETHGHVFSSVKKSRKLSDKLERLRISIFVRHANVLFKYIIFMSNIHWKMIIT